MPIMLWNKLFSQKRTRLLMGGRKSSRTDDDPRTEFERDYGRAVFSTPVRRLQDKTQVFPLEPNDSVRTRLTHSLEVSNVARDLVKYTLEAARSKGCVIPEHAATDGAVIAATVGLIHDIGNPPFGHAGEDAMCSWFSHLFSQNPNLLADLGGESSQYAQDFLRFEGNAQTIRLLGRLQILADYYGLNLTAATLSAACKYVAPSDLLEPKSGRHDYSKPGYFASEKQLVDRIRKEVGTGEARHPLTFLIEAADDAVYSVADLEDGVKKGVLQWETLRSELLDNLDGDIANQTRKIVEGAENYIDRSQVCPKGREREVAIVQMFRTNVIGVHVAAAREEFIKRFNEIMAGSYHGELLKDGTTATILKRCKTIGGKYVYTADNILRLEIYGRRVLHDLMTVFWEGASQAPAPARKSFAEKSYSLLSSNYRKVFQDEHEKGTLPLTYLRLQLVSDYVAGMTDSFATNLHRELFGRDS